MKATSECKVGPILSKGELAEAFVCAIREQNTDANIIDGGAYYRVEVPSHCIITKEVVEKYAKKAISFPMDLELVMPSFTGLLCFQEDSVTWSSQ